ncbi:MAG TPA: EAL domain-containing protein [Noviherbaspirillum sp.]|nr:EAL domain-containing protein [Noviherbaspirillum sp.]
MNHGDRHGPGPALRSAALRPLVAGVLYWLAAAVSLPLAVPGAIISPIWPAAALALFLSLRWGQRVIPAIGLGAALAFLTHGWPLPGSLIVGSAAALAAWGACSLICRMQQREGDFTYNGNLFVFILIALACSLITAPLAAAGAMTAGRLGPDPWLGPLTWTLGTATGMIIFTPLLRAWRVNRGIDWTRGKLFEAAMFTALLLFSNYIAFTDWFGPLPLSYLPVPFVIWAAYRFNVPAVAWTTALICLTAAWGTMRGAGPFAHADINSALLLLAVYVSVLGATGLTLSSLLSERALAEGHLTRERDQLEQRVLERTDALRDELHERKRVEQQLAEAQQVALIGSWNWELEERNIQWSDQLYRIYGIPLGTKPPGPRSYVYCIHPDDVPKVNEAFVRCRDEGTPFSFEHRIVLPDGSVRVVAARGRGEKGPDGRVVRLFGTVQDITEAHEAELALKEAQERYRRVVEISPDAIVIQQGDEIVFANPASERLIGGPLDRPLIGRSILDLIHPDARETFIQHAKTLQEGRNLVQAESAMLRVDGSRLDVEISATPFPHQGKLAVLYTMRDITERKRSAEQLAYLAHYDSLTGLPNRLMFHQQLEHALSVAARPHRTLEVLFLDLDRFKQINDTLGHEAGDAVLKEAARRLRSSLRESDTVARLAGDEFVVLVENVDEPQRGGTIAEKILSAFSRPFSLHDSALQIGTSIGIAAYPVDALDAATLVKRADEAMYRAKQARNSYCYYSAHLNSQQAERRTLEQALRLAVERGEMTLHYQPRIDVASGNLVGMEALLRWTHPQLGPVAPRHFLPLAEKSGLILPIGYWGLRLACVQTRQWQDGGAGKLKVAVNLSARQLADPALVENIRAILDETGLDAQALEVEITEDAMRAEPERAMQAIKTLHAAGVRVALDDFGTGYSSLGRLKQIPFDAVKIDRSFIQGLPTDAADAAITRGIIQLGHSLQCHVVAQGAETQQQFDFLRAHACDSVQGFYFSEAMPPAHFNELVHAQFH